MGLSQSRRLGQVLYQAIQDNDQLRIRSVVSALQEDGTNINLLIGPRNEPPVAAAVFHMTDSEQKVTLETLNFMIDEMKFDVNATANGEFGFSPLYNAVRKNKLEVAKKLLDAGADPNKTLPESHDTPIVFAAALGYKEMVSMLLEKGADANSPAPGPGGTPLFLTLQSSHYRSLEITQVLVEHGCDPCRKNQIGRTALHAAAEGMADITLCLDFLLEKGVDINSRDNKNTTPLMLAALTDKEKVCDYLMKHGADLTLKNKEGRTAYDIAVEHANEKSLSVLKEYVRNGVIITSN